jgi:hypothetical protein
MIYPSVKYLGPAHPARVATKTSEAVAVAVRDREAAGDVVPHPHAYLALTDRDSDRARWPVDFELSLAA